MADHKPALQKIIKSIHESMLPGESINLDIIFHVEKNPHPLTHYETIVRELRENQHSNRIKTTDTLICAVNAPKNSENKYGCSNLSVMKRGKQPEKLLNSSAVPTFYWKSFSKKRGEDEGTYHYIQWRLNEEGIVSFILDINSTDHLPHKSNWPIIEPAIYTLQDLIKKDINPELFVLKDILTTSFNRYLNSTFGRLKVKESLSNLPSYERLLEDIINKRPHKLNEALYILYDLKDKKINCDFWDKETDIYNSFILILKLLNIQFSSDLSLVEYLQVKNKVILIVDSTGKRDYELYENKFYEKIISNYNVDLIIFQRMILINWNGAPVPHDEINTSVAKIASVSSDPCSGVQLPDISKPQKPLLMTIEYIIKQLEEKELTPYEIERKINECFQFSNSW